MKNLKSEALTGENNERLYATDCLNEALTEARGNKAKLLNHSKVSVPSEMQTSEAKEWVDNGSKL